MTKLKTFKYWLEDAIWLVCSLAQEYWLIMLVFGTLFLIIWLARFLLPAG